VFVYISRRPLQSPFWALGGCCALTPRWHMGDFEYEMEIRFNDQREEVKVEEDWFLFPMLSRNISAASATVPGTQENFHYPFGSMPIPECRRSAPLAVSSKDLLGSRHDFRGVCSYE
jgi:hypothetical protein